MNKYLVCFFIAVCSFVQPLFAAQVERELTLDDSITTGLHNSQELLSCQEQIYMAKQRIKEAGSQIYPKIDLNLSISKIDNDFPTVLAQSFNSVYLPSQNIDAFYSTRISLWQYLYANGRYSTNLTLAETSLSQAMSSADIARNRVVLEVKRSFYACVVLREKIKLYESAVTASGSRPGYELSSLKLTLFKLKHEYEKQKLKHLKALGIELNTVVDIKGDISAPVEEYDLDKCLVWAKNFRPELRQTQFQETIDSLRVNLSLAERFPTVTLGANYERLGDKIQLDMTNWNATINLNLPLFDGWASWSRIKQQKAKVREGKIRRAGIQDKVSADVREAYLDYAFWKARAAETDEAARNAGQDKKFESELLRLDTMEQALSNQAFLEWSIGKIFFK